MKHFVVGRTVCLYREECYCGDTHRQAMLSTTAPTFIYIAPRLKIPEFPFKSQTREALHPLTNPEDEQRQQTQSKKGSYKKKKHIKKNKKSWGQEKPHQSTNIYYCSAPRLCHHVCTVCVSYVCVCVCTACVHVFVRLRVYALYKIETSLTI